MSEFPPDIIGELQTCPRRLLGKSRSSLNQDTDLCPRGHPTCAVRTTNCAHRFRSRPQTLTSCCNRLESSLRSDDPTVNEERPPGHVPDGLFFVHFSSWRVNLECPENAHEIVRLPRPRETVRRIQEFNLNSHDGVVFFYPYKPIWETNPDLRDRWTRTFNHLLQFAFFCCQFALLVAIN